MTDGEIRTLRHLAGVLMQAAAGMAEILEAHEEQEPEQERKRRPRFMGDDEPQHPEG
jgi:hypothetical protein